MPRILSLPCAGFCPIYTRPPKTLITGTSFRLPPSTTTQSICRTLDQSQAESPRQSRLPRVPYSKNSPDLPRSVLQIPPVSYRNRAIPEFAVLPFSNQLPAARENSFLIGSLL